MFSKLLRFSRVLISNHAKTKTFSIAKLQTARKYSAGLAFAGFNIVRCDPKPITCDTESLEHEFYIKQACTSNVTAACQLLTVTIVAIQDTCQRIRQELAKEITLLRRAVEWGENTPEEHFDQLIEVRSILDDLKHNLQVLIGYMEYAERIATMAAEVSYLSGNVGASDIVCERIDQVGRAYRAEVEQNETLQMESLGWQRVAIESDNMKEILEPENDAQNKHTIQNA
ncbi:uncharacterized protein LOC143917131 [Arctopsyche grandis]|uniref:uncharacterized protein LOC143917131 n=1 Tax=Arctopsyche grandis TaxID=121162 RepID=UPI00406D7D06